MDNAYDNIVWNGFKSSFVGLIVVNATFNNISAISCRLVLLVEETGVSGENHCEAFSHNVSCTPRLSGVRTHTVSESRVTRLLTKVVTT
jgi:hypothetical protein